MAKHIGIVACSAEGASLCYQTLSREAPDSMGEHLHPEVSMHTHPLGLYMKHVRSGNWKEVSSLMLSSVGKLADIGADFAICPDNTIHQAFDLVESSSPIPWLHIAKVVAQEAKELGYQRLGITGTKYLMTGPVYPRVLEQFGLDWLTPGGDAQNRIDDIIFSELVKGVFLEDSRSYFYRVIDCLRGQGCDAVILGCNEIPLLVEPGDSPLPVLDSTRLLAKAALKLALSEV